MATEKDKKYRVWATDYDDKRFVPICNYLEKHIVRPNLSKNGGTLNYNNLTYQSEILILVALGNEILGYNSLVHYGDSLYVYQIAVKKEYQQQGIGTLLMQKAMEIAKELDVDVTANVMEYNTNSKKMFTRLGFDKLDVIDGNGFYRYEQPGKEIGSK